MTIKLISNISHTAPSALPCRNRRRTGLAGKILASLAALLLLQGTAMAQNTLKGVLYDKSNGEIIPFANVILEGTSMGTATDLNGIFLINKIPDGKYTLLVRYVGYDEYREEITLSGHKVLSRNINLSPSSHQLKTVVVTENRNEERKVQTQVSVEKITATQIQQMPSIGGQADLAQYLQVLPGVNSTGDQGGQLYIRGGSMIQNLCLLDGMVVYNPFHSIGLYSIFETDIILNANIYTGGFGAEYGGRLSSVMDITTRDGNKKRHSGKVGLNTFGANVVMEGPLKRETEHSSSTITYLLTAKNSYLSKSSKLFYPNIAGGLPFDYNDLYGKVSINSGNGSKINVFGFRFDDTVDNYQSIADYHWRNIGAGTNFVLLTRESAVIDGTFAYSDYFINLDDASAKEKYSSINGFNMSLNVTNFLGRNKIRCGLNMEGYSTEYRFTNQYNISRKQEKENTTQLSAYATYNINTSKWLIDPGLRFVFYASLQEPLLEPRIAAKYNATDKFRLKLAGGRYSQILLDARPDNDIVNLFNGFLTGAGNLNLPTVYRDKPVESCVQKATHLVVGAEYDITRHLVANVEGYFKRFDQLLSINHNQMYDRNDPAYQNGGIYEKPQYYLTDFIIENGYAAGADASLCLDIDNLYVWATYSLGFVRRTDETQTYSPHYDRRHTVNLLTTFTWGSQHQWEVSGRWCYGSGFPYTQTQGVYEQLVFVNGIASNYTSDNGEFGVHYGELYGGRLPAYHRLDLGLKRKFSVGKRGIVEVDLSATNISNRDNLFYVDRLSASRVNQLPILVSLGGNYKF